MIEAVTNMSLRYDEEEVKVDMCKAIQDMQLESEQKGELRCAQRSARSFYKMGLKVEQIAEGIGYDVETVKAWLDL